MANKELKNDLCSSGLKQDSARRLVEKLEAAHRAGTLKPVNQSAKPLTRAVRVTSPTKKQNKP